MKFQNSDFHWDELPGYFFDGPLLGNGLLGAVLHRRAPQRGDARELLWEFNRSDVIDTGYFQAEGYVWTRIGIGKLCLRTRGEITASRWHLSIHDALLRGEIETACGALKVRCFIHATQPVFWLEVESSGEENGQDFSFLPDRSGPIRDFGRVDFEETATHEPLNLPAELCVSDEIYLHRQTLHCAERSFCLAWKQQRNGEKSVYAATIEYSHPQEKSGEFGASQILADALQTGFDEALKTHRKWWQAHYESGAQVWLDEITEVFYARRHYVLGCIARPDGPMLDLIGPWYCHTIWRAVWWNLNTQCAYLPLAMSNRPELIEPLRRVLWRERENLRRNAPAEWQHDSLAMGRASSYDCYSPLDFSVTDFSDPRDEGRLEAGKLLWALHPLYLQWRADGDNETAKKCLYPLLKGAVNGYFHLLQRGDDEKYHLPRTFSPEYKAAPDCSYDLSLLRWGLSTLIELDKALSLHDAQALRWRETLNHLAPLAEDESGVLIGRGVALSESHRHFSHLLGYWPLKILTPDNCLRRSLQHWISMPEALAGYSFAAASAMFALLGEGENALRWLHKLISPGGKLSQTTLYREAGLCLETPLVAMQSIHEMLILVQDGVIVPFPLCVPGWENARFENLRVDSCCVGAQRRNGELVEVKIHAPKDTEIRMQLPHDAAPVKNNEIFTLLMRAGETATWRKNSSSQWNCSTASA